jgi:hypothetical protein
LLKQKKRHYLQNDKALNNLKKIQNIYNLIIVVFGITLIYGFFVAPVVGLTAGILALITISFSRQVDRTIPVIEELLKIGEITIVPNLRTEQGIVDIFTKTLDDKYFIFTLVSCNSSFLIWNNEKQSFFTKTVKKNGSIVTKPWPLLIQLYQDLNIKATAVRREFGLSNSSTVVIKAIILTGKTSLDFDFGQSLYQCHEPQSSSDNIHILKQEDLAKFINV